MAICSGCGRNINETTEKCLFCGKSQASQSAAVGMSGSSEDMTITGLLVRFALIYILGIIGFYLIIDFVGLKTSSGNDTGPLIMAVLGACSWFAKKNNRFLDYSEKKIAVLGMLGIDMVLQLLGLGFLRHVVANMNVSGTIFAGLLGGLVHGIGIYFMVGIAGRSYVKQSS